MLNHFSFDVFYILSICSDFKMIRTNELPVLYVQYELQYDYELPKTLFKTTASLSLTGNVWTNYVNIILIKSGKGWGGGGRKDNLLP